jgi:Rieske Fe-S protein
LAEELQRDPVTRGQFLWMGAMGTFIGAALAIPSAAYVLDPAIKAVTLGRSDVPGEWRPLGSVFEVPADEPKVFRVEFTQRQTYNQEGSIVNAVLVSWRDGEMPDILSGGEEKGLREGEIRELEQQINVLSNACAHLGCPVRWIPGRGEIRCPCHGGGYDINGNLLAGPPPRGLYHYAFEIREDGGLYVKHRFDGTPYVY